MRLGTRAIEGIEEYPRISEIGSHDLFSNKFFKLVGIFHRVISLKLQAIRVRFITM